MSLAVAGFARRKLHACRSLHTEFAMYTDGLNRDYVRVALAAVYSREAALVPALVCTDMALEAFSRTVNRLLELYEVGFVAVVTGIRRLGIVGLRG